MSESSKTTVGILCGAGAGALWGFVFLAPALVQDTHPLNLTVCRYICYGLVSLLLFWPRRRAITAGLQASDWVALFKLALIGNVVYYVCLSFAVQIGGIALTSLVVGFLPVTVTVVGHRDEGALPLSRLRVPLALCVAGAVCIGWQALSAPMAGDVGRQLVGLGCAVGALLAWTWYAVQNGRHVKRLRAVSTHDWNLLTGLMTGALALLLSPLALFVAGTHASDVTVRLLAVSGTLALAASVLGNSLWNTMSRLLPMTLVGQMILFETLFALAYGFLWEQRWPSPLETLASACVGLSVVSCVSAHRQPPQARASMGA